MIKLSDGMMWCRCIEKYTMTAYEFYFYEGMLKKLHCYDYCKKETKFEDIYDSPHHNLVQIENFDNAFEIFCQESNGGEIKYFIEQLENDLEFKSNAQRILKECAYQTAKKAQELVDVLVSI